MKWIAAMAAAGMAGVAGMAGCAAGPAASREALAAMEEHQARTRRVWLAFECRMPMMGGDASVRAQVRVDRTPGAGSRPVAASRPATASRPAGGTSMGPLGDAIAAGIIWPMLFHMPAALMERDSVKLLGYEEIDRQTCWLIEGRLAEPMNPGGLGGVDELEAVDVKINMDGVMNISPPAEREGGTLPLPWRKKEGQSRPASRPAAGPWTVRAAVAVSDGVARRVEVRDAEGKAAVSVRFTDVRVLRR